MAPRPPTALKGKQRNRTGSDYTEKKGNLVVFLSPLHGKFELDTGWV